MLYIITDGTNYKLGYSQNPASRLKELQTANAKPLVLLGTIEGEIEDEKRYHKLLGNTRLVGEWFSPSPKLFEILGEWVANKVAKVVPVYYIEIPDLFKIKVKFLNKEFYFKLSSCASLLNKSTDQIKQIPGVTIKLIDNWIYLDETSFLELFHNNLQVLNKFFELKCYVK